MAMQLRLMYFQSTAATEVDEINWISKYRTDEIHSVRIRRLVDSLLSEQVGLVQETHIAERPRNACMVRFAKLLKLRF